MKSLIINVCLVITLLVIIVFISVELLKMEEIDNRVTFIRIALLFLAIGLAISHIRDVVRSIKMEYWIYRSNRPVKILHWVKSKLDK